MVWCSQVNHLSPFLLTLELLPSLMETADSSGDCRVVFVASIAHQRGVWAPQNRNAEKSFDKHLFYGNSKLYNVSAIIITHCCLLIVTDLIS